MTLAFSTADGSAPRYRPGVCNIGPAEIRRRRLVGHAGALVTVAMLVGLVAVDAPPLARLTLILPAAGAASGYLQAWLKFCAGFGSRGVANLGPLGQRMTITDRAALDRDRRRSREIGAMALAVGALVGIGALLLPL